MPVSQECVSCSSKSKIFQREGDVENSCVLESFSPAGGAPECSVSECQGEEKLMLFQAQSIGSGIACLRQDWDVS